MNTTECLFCKIVAHSIPVTPAYEDDLTLAFADIHPQAPTHLLAIPKQHFSSVEEAPAELLGRLLHTAAVIGRTQLPDGYRIVINTGANGGQTVQHLHLHILGERAMTWPPG